MQSIAFTIVHAIRTVFAHHYNLTLLWQSRIVQDQLIVSISQRHFFR